MAAFFLGGLLGAVAAPAGERVYGAEPNDSRWTVTSERYLCRLEHPIPQFGRALFIQPLDGELRFELHSLRPQQAGSVALRAIPPEWRPGFPIVELGSVRLSEARQAVTVRDQRSEWLLAELEEGIYPAIFYPEPAAGRGGVSVVLSGIRFRPALDRFLECRAQLLGTNVAALRAKTVRFATNKSALGKKERAALSELAEFVKSGGEQRKVIIEAHADSRGSARYNQRLSQKRARAVREFLLQQGVGSHQIQIATFGENKPVASNRTPSGRAENRRALVRVVN
ncbi:MAG: OmpA family protein [Gammaproteobacteria bacterium]